MPKINTSLLPNALLNAENHLLDLKFRESTIGVHVRIWNKFSRYLDELDTTTFDESNIEDFFKLFWGFSMYETLIPYHRQLLSNLFLLFDFIPDCKLAFDHQKRKILKSTSLLNLMEVYSSSLESTDIAKVTKQNKKDSVLSFLVFMEKIELNVPANWCIEDITVYMKSLKQYANTTIENKCYTLRSFLKFLSDLNYNLNHLEKFFIHIPTYKQDTLPSCYECKEITRVLNSIDIDTPIGKRDYSMLLLASSFAMRAGDIVNLKLDNIKWSLNSISWIQHKTKNMLTLPMTNEIKLSLLDYLKNARPQSDSKFVFLTTRAPYKNLSGSSNIFGALQKYLFLSGVNISQRKHGPHSLRHSVAYSILAEVPLPTITGVLGHANSNTTRAYLRIDLEKLRLFALEVPNAY